MRHLNHILSIRINQQLGAMCNLRHLRQQRLSWWQTQTKSLLHWQTVASKMSLHALTRRLSPMLKTSPKLMALQPQGRHRPSTRAQQAHQLHQVQHQFRHVHRFCGSCHIAIVPKVPWWTMMPPHIVITRQPDPVHAVAAHPRRLSTAYQTRRRPVSTQMIVARRVPPPRSSF